MTKANNNKSKQVASILARVPETRSDDREMLATYWRGEMPMLFAFCTAEAMLRSLVNRELTSPETIIRLKRMAQARDASLRGNGKKQAP